MKHLLLALGLAALAAVGLSSCPSTGDGWKTVTTESALLAPTFAELAQAAESDGLRDTLNGLSKALEGIGAGEPPADELEAMLAAIEILETYLEESGGDQDLEFALIGARAIVRRIQAYTP